jgi:rifampin ADP-ribosylating transferase
MQNDVTDRLRWLETALQRAAHVDGRAVQSAHPLLHAEIAQCYERLHQTDAAQNHRALAKSSVAAPSDQGPFYHGTKADLREGDLLLPGGISNYKSDLTMNHIYFTALLGGAGLAASMAKGPGPERIYTVEPVGEFEDDPNVTNKRFPGNPTRSYRSRSPLRIVGERTDWARQTAEEQQEWRRKLAGSKGEIIN